MRLSKKLLPSFDSSISQSSRQTQPHGHVKKQVNLWHSVNKKVQELIPNASMLGQDALVWTPLIGNNGGSRNVDNLSESTNHCSVQSNSSIQCHTIRLFLFFLCLFMVLQEWLLHLDNSRDKDLVVLWHFGSCCVDVWIYYTIASPFQQFTILICGSTFGGTRS